MYFQLIELIKSKPKAATKRPGDTCGVDEWQCDNDQCINVEFVCDGTNDCTDNSDEGRICATKHSGNEIEHSSVYFFFFDDFMNCNDGKCGEKYYITLSSFVQKSKKMYVKVFVYSYFI